MKQKRLAWIAALLSVASIPTASWAVDAYTIGPEDQLSISVWDRPDLTRTLRVRASGEISFPPLGDLQAAGFTASELSRRIEERLVDFLRRPTQVTVEVTAYQSRRVTVAGAVGTPGGLAFERIPGLVEILGVAGGLGPTGDLSRVQIFRSGARQKTSITVDLTRALAEGDLTGMPEVLPNDLIFVPAIGGPAAPGHGSVHVAGQVARPGPYGVGAGLDLLKVLALSGGALPTADLRRVQVVGFDSAGGNFVATVDVERYLRDASSPFLVRPGDTVRVPSRDRALTRAAWGAAREVLGVSRDILNLFLISDILREN